MPGGVYGLGRIVGAVLTLVLVKPPTKVLAYRYKSTNADSTWRGLRPWPYRRLRLRFQLFIRRRCACWRMLAYADAC
jgi:hypothetical protein